MYMTGLWADKQKKKKKKKKKKKRKKNVLQKCRETKKKTSEINVNKQNKTNK